MKRKNHVAIAIGVILLLSTVIIASSSSSLISVAKSQPTTEQPLPVLLIHGYRSTHEVWDRWEYKLGNVGITSHAVTFNGDDECGTAEEHAAELSQIVEDFKTETGAEKINIVAHSKGGLDARRYLANDLSNKDVASLIMIGTPNRGSPLADRYHDSDECKPAVYDLLTTAPVTRVPKNPNTKYYTIASDWNSVYWPPFTSFDINCPYPSNWFDLEGWNLLAFQYRGRNEIRGPDDGIVPLRSADPSTAQFTSRGHTNNCHTNLFTNEEYNKAIGILRGLE